MPVSGLFMCLALPPSPRLAVEILDPIATSTFFNGSNALDVIDHGNLSNIGHTMFALGMCGGPSGYSESQNQVMASDGKLKSQQQLEAVRVSIPSHSSAIYTTVVFILVRK